MEAILRMSYITNVFQLLVVHSLLILFAYTFVSDIVTKFFTP